MKRSSKTSHTPEIVEMDRDQLEEVVGRAEQKLDAADAQYIRAVFESYEYITGLVDDKSTSLQRLRKLLFGSRSEKTADVAGEGTSSKEVATDEDEEEEDGAAAPEPLSAELRGQSPDHPATGHGRHGAEAYRGAEQVHVPHEDLAAGDACPECDGGKLYHKTPGVLIRIVGQAPLGATVYRLQKLRCHLCGKVFTAAAPSDAGDQKYSATAASMIALLKYGSGLPFNRLQRLQANCQIPLPASTQWQVIDAVAPVMQPAYEQLIRQAACGEVVYNDDTTIKILSLVSDRAPPHAAASNGEDASPAESIFTDRKGLFTTGVVSTCSVPGEPDRRIALFFSGPQHAGENLRDVLQHRAAELGAPIQMCDGLSRNVPQELETILANCLAHGRREFVDLYDRFSGKCRHVLEALAVVYRHDAVARQEKMSADQRLAFHRAQSGPTMDALHDWLEQQFEDKLVEPNSALGTAINYLLKRWDALTLFLRQPGAPLDNNLCERALKKAILHRKNSLFYKTANGARLGDLFMSLIYTCELSAANALDYLTALQQNADEVAEHPEQWLPWSYRATIDAEPAAA